LADITGIPYTTLVDWRKANWRPKAVETLEKLSLAAEADAKASRTGGVG
jgi:hypothetical protein